MRSLIIGGGAIGQYFAARLAQEGHEPVILARRPQADAIDANGIALKTASGTSVHRLQAAFDPSDASLAAPFELVIVAVKAYSTPDAVATIRAVPACQDAAILTVQNGLGNEEVLAGAFGAERVVAGALTVAVDRLDARSIAATTKGGLCLAPLGSNPQNWIIAALAGSGMVVRAVADWRALKWSKLLINILGNGVCAALDWLPEHVYADRAAFAIERSCLLEAIDVMARLGLKPVNLIDFPSALLAASARRLPADLLRIVLAQRVAGGRGGKLPSLLIDLRAHRPRSEVTALNGAVASRADQAGTGAPANSAVAQVVSGVASGVLDWDEYRGRPDRLYRFR